MCNPGFLYQGYISYIYTYHNFHPPFQPNGLRSTSWTNLWRWVTMASWGGQGMIRWGRLSEDWTQPAPKNTCIYIIYIYICIYIYKLVVAFKVGCLKQWNCCAFLLQLMRASPVLTRKRACPEIASAEKTACWIVGSFIQKPNVIWFQEEVSEAVVLFVAKVSGKSKPSYFLAWLSRKQENIIGYVYRIM